MTADPGKLAGEVNELGAALESMLNDNLQLREDKRLLGLRIKELECEVERLKEIEWRMKGLEK